MAQTKKELVQASFGTEGGGPGTGGFWFHFLADPEKQDALVDQEKAAANIAGHRRFYEDFQPDFVKIMSDGYFGYPHPGLARVKTAADLGRLEPLETGIPGLTPRCSSYSACSRFWRGGAELL